jgi:flagella basal body P-ring formation protein FlgA
MLGAVVGAVLWGVGGGVWGVGNDLHPTSDTVLVARHDLARGVALTAADVDTVVTADAPHPTPHALDGWLTRRVIRAGEPLRAPAVEPPPLIARGARVTVVWETAGLRVTREGTAVGAAHRGERVVVRVDGLRRLAGIATDAGTVTVVP